MFYILYPMETISAITKPYIQDDSSQVQEGRRKELFFWGGNYDSQTAQSVTRLQQQSAQWLWEMNVRTETVTEGWSPGWRWRDRDRDTERASVSGTQCGPEYMEGGEQLPRDSEPAVTRGTLVLSPKRRKRMREKTQRTQRLTAFLCSRWNWNRSPIWMDLD